MNAQIDFSAAIELLKGSLGELTNGQDRPIFVVADLFVLLIPLVEDLNKRIAAIETASNQ